MLPSAARRRVEVTAQRTEPTMRTPSKAVILVAGGVAALGAGVLVADFIGNANDPTDSVGAVSVGDLDVASPSTPSSVATSETGNGVPTTAARQQIIALEELTGRLDRYGDDVDDYTISGVELDFGPDNWILGAGPLADYDGNGSAGPLREELDALTATDVRVLVRYDEDRDEADVYVLNDQPYRDTTGGDAPWQTPVAGESATREQLIAAAQAAVGDGARVMDLDQDDGTAGWYAEVVGADGREYDVILGPDAEVLQVRNHD